MFLLLIGIVIFAVVPYLLVTNTKAGLKTLGLIIGIPLLLAGLFVGGVGVLYLTFEVNALFALLVPALFVMVGLVVKKVRSARVATA